MKKFISLLLAVIMCASVLPLSVMAEETKTVYANKVFEENTDERFAAWNENYEVMLATLLDETHYAHIKYVIDNNEDIQKEMAVYTAFGLYEDAWKNYFTQSVNVDTCEKILMIMIEEYYYDMGTSYVDYVREALGYADDAMDTIEDIAGVAEDIDEFLGEFTTIFADFAEFLDFTETEEWTTTGTVIDYLIKAGNQWGEIRADLIDAYSQIIAVQRANAYYLEMLQYVAENTTYEPMQKAAENLFHRAITDVQDQMGYLAFAAIDDQIDTLCHGLITYALNSNVYTSTMLEIYGTVVDIADFLFNVKDMYPAYDNLIAAYYAEEAIDAFATESLDATAEDFDAGRAIFAMYSLLSTRVYGEEAIYHLLEVKSEGLINKIQSVVYDYTCAEYAANLAALDLMQIALFETAPEDMNKIESIVHVYCPVNVLVWDVDETTLLYRIKDGEETVFVSEYGMGKGSYNAYDDEYVKVAFMYDVDCKVVLVGVDDGYVTFVKKFIDENGVLQDYSFTEEALTPTTKIVIKDLGYSVTKDGITTYKDLNDDFLVPDGKEVTWDTVTDATKDVVENETKSLLQKIKEFFANLIASIKKLFGIEEKSNDAVVVE